MSSYPLFLQTFLFSPLSWDRHGFFLGFFYQLCLESTNPLILTYCKHHINQLVRFKSSQPIFIQMPNKTFRKIGAHWQKDWCVFSERNASVRQVPTRKPFRLTSLVKVCFGNFFGCQRSIAHCFVLFCFIICIFVLTSMYKACHIAAPALYFFIFNIPQLAAEAMLGKAERPQRTSSQRATVLGRCCQFANESYVEEVLTNPLKFWDQTLTITAHPSTVKWRKSLNNFQTTFEQVEVQGRAEFGFCHTYAVFFFLQLRAFVLIFVDCLSLFTPISVEGRSSKHDMGSSRVQQNMDACVFDKHTNSHTHTLHCDCRFVEFNLFFLCFFTCLTNGSIGKSAFFSVALLCLLRKQRGFVPLLIS